MKQKKGGTSVGAFTDRKLKLVNEVLLYYHFLCQDNKVADAEDPTLWVKEDFRKWESNGYPQSTEVLNAACASNTANASNATLNATNTTVPASITELEEDVWLSWRWSKQDETVYPLLENDRMYTDWIVKFKRKITSKEMFRMIDPNFHKN